VRVAIVIALCTVGVFSSLTGGLGVVRMPDLYSRLQCSTKNITMGTLPVLVALVVGEGPLSPYGGRALLVGFLILVVSPTASHALARAAYKTGVPMWKGAVRDEPHQQEVPTVPDDDVR
jgi:multicomponent Na+:H+ antiporter subunit G